MFALLKKLASNAKKNQTSSNIKAPRTTDLHRSPVMAKLFYIFLICSAFCTVSSTHHQIIHITAKKTEYIP